MDFVITTYCNLNCKNCCALMSYYKKPFHYKVEDIEINLAKLNKCSKFKNIQLIGGETLLHPDINRIIKYISTLDFNDISIYTNCTVIPNDFEDVLKILDDRFTICLTQYGDKSKCFNQLVELCEKYNVRYEINGFGNIPGVAEGKEWIKSGSPDIKPLPKIDLDTCGQVMSCMGDRIYRCQRFGHIHQILGIELDEDEWCSIDDIEECYDDMKEIKFSKTCNRCLRGTSMAINIPKGS